MTALYIALAAMAAVFLILVLVGLIVFLAAARAPKHKFIVTEKTLIKFGLGAMSGDIMKSLTLWRALPPEDVYITSFDGLRLHARFARAREPRATVILFHGWRTAGEFDFSAILFKYLEKGLNVLLADERAHGDSEGKYITFGINESRDVACWAKYIESREGSALPIIIEGMSMGAASVLMAAARDIPTNVVGIIADCGFTSPRAIISSVVGKYHLPAKLIFPFVKLWFKLLAKIDTDELSTVSAMKQCTLPVLFIHGEADDFVPHGMSVEAFTAHPGEATLISVAGAGHGLSYTTDKEKVSRGLDEFLEKILRS